MTLSVEETRAIREALQVYFRAHAWLSPSELLQDAAVARATLHDCQIVCHGKFGGPIRGSGPIVHRWRRKSCRD